jgi:NAD dependent epimerase/dehydratase family enzyme
MRILIVGGTGFIGNARLSVEGHEWVTVARHAIVKRQAGHVQVDLSQTDETTGQR